MTNDHVLQALPQDVIITVEDLVNSVTDTTHTPYQQLKYRPLSSYTLSSWALVNGLLDTPPLDDCSSFVLMDLMQSLLPQDEPTGALFLGLFLQRLPQQMCPHVASHQFDSLH